MELIKHEKYEMYYIQWPNGDLSEDFYNLTRAKEILRREGVEDYLRNVTYHSPYDTAEARLEARTEV